MTEQKVQRERCTWCGHDPLYVHYHDREWGVPVYDDQKLFEFLILEGAQAGLSWITILKRRDGYREAFENFEVDRVANFSSQKIEELMNNPKIIRNRLKIQSAVQNAKAFRKIQDEFGGFCNYQWQWVFGQPIQNKWNTTKEIPAKSELSNEMSKDLKFRGFSFVGSTIVYAHLQATGVVNDHLIQCFRYKDLK